MAKTLTEYHKVNNYVMKVRLYPNKEQRAKLEDLFLALENAPNGKPLIPEYGVDRHVSSMFLTVGSAFFRSEEGRVSVDLPKIGKMRIRGWNEKIRFGKNASLSWFDYMKGSRKQMGCVISKNGLDEYYISIRMLEAYRPFRTYKQKADVSVNVGVGKTLLSSYTEEGGLKPYSDKVFKNPEEDTLRLYAGQMSRRYGMSNIAYRDECDHIRAESERLASEGKNPLPLPEPSGRYKEAWNKSD